MREEQDSGEESRTDFQFNGRVRGLRFQQVALLRVCLACLPDGVHEDALSRGIHGCAADIRNGKCGEGSKVHQRSARHEYFDLAAGCK